MKNILKYMMLLLVVLSISSCKKYKYEKEDVYGIYDIHKYYVDDFDSTFYFEQFKSSYVAFTDNSDIMDFICHRLDTNNTFMVSTRAYWKFINQNERINVNVARAIYNNEYWIQHGPLALGKEYNWEIINLDTKELVLLTSYDNRIYKLILYRR